jgi:hypothetical protein
VYPTISSGKNSKVLISSTPNGFNHFYKMWKDAQNCINGFNPIFVHWSDVPGRDEKWKDGTLKAIGEQKFTQEFDCEFLGSTNTLIASKYIRNMAAEKPVFISENDKLNVYRQPEENHNYLVVCDPSRGTGNDYSAFIVYDISEYPIKICAKFYDNNISPILLPVLLLKVARHYHSASVLIETNDNGQQVADTLWRELEYENTIFIGFHSDVPGVKTTKSVKRLGCSMFKDMIEAQKLIVNDTELIQEIANFVAKKQGYEADEGHHDDLVMCCVLFSWFAATDEFKDVSNTNFKKILHGQKMKEIEDNLIPFYVDNGIDKIFPDENIVWTQEDRFF